MVEVQRQLGLRNIDVLIANPIKKNINQHSSNIDKTIVDKDNTDKEHLEAQNGKKHLEDIVAKFPEIRKETLF